MAGVTAEIRVVDNVSPMLRGAIRAMADRKPALRTAGAYMYRETVRQFQTEGARSGDNWPPLRRSTIRRRRKKSAAILQDTGRLRRSVVSRGGPDSIYDLSDTKLRIGTNLEYALIHQMGGTIDRVSRAGKVRIRRTRRGPRFAKSSFKGNARTVRYSGGKAFTIHIPARPFLVVTKGDEQQIGGIFLRHAIRGFNQR